MAKLDNRPKQGFGDMRVAESQALASRVRAPALPATPTPEEKPLQVEEVKDPNKLADRIRKSDATLTELQGLADEYETNRIVPKDRTDELKSAISEARRLYGETASRNDWLQVAQTLSRAVAQFGAAAAGQKTGRNMAGLDFGPGIDYEARSSRALREFELEREGFKDVAKSSRQREEDEAQRQKEVYGAKSKSLQEVLDTQREQERLEDQHNKAIELARMQGDREALRQRLRDKDDFDRQAERDRAEQLRDLRTQLKLKQDELKASTTAANMLSSMDDLSSKSQKKLETQLPGVLGKAGITPEDLAQIEQESQVPGRIYGTNTDTEKRNQLIKQKLVEKKQGEIGSLMDAIDSLSRRRSNGTPPASVGTDAQKPTQQPSAPASGMVKMRAPNGQLGEVPADKVAAAEAKGLVRVE